ncbi:MAG: hypothetical protein H0T51_07770 [Pirellulales bacterium]|nr:hypothetical protein [Pirellulales bacterium]
MTDAESHIRILQAQLDRMLVELANADRNGKAVETWCKALTQFLSTVATATRQRQHGEASLTAQLVAGLPNPDRGVRTGFIASVR